MDMNGILDILSYKYFVEGDYFKKGRVVFANRVKLMVDWLSGCFFGGQPFVVVVGV